MSQAAESRGAAPSSPSPSRSRSPSPSPSTPPPTAAAAAAPSSSSPAQPPAELQPPTPSQPTPDRDPPNLSPNTTPHIIVSPASGASLALLSSSSPPSSPSPGGSPRLSPAASPRRGHRRTPSHVPVYDALTCPDELSPELFSRIVDKFRELDVRADGHTACDGLVDYDALAACFDEVIGDRLPEEVVERLVENRSRYLAKQVHIYDFLESVVRVHNRHKQYLRGLQDGSSGRLDRQRTHSASAKFSLYRRKTKEILFEDERMLGWHQLNCCGRMLRDFDLWWDRNWRQRRALVPLWKKPFEMIEARFGASTSEYFYFARSILWLNIVLAVLYCFIVVPGIIEFDNEDPDTGEREVSGDEWVGLFIGTGMEKTWMFYDGYKASYGSYKMDLAWILITGIMLFLSLLLTLSFIDKGAQRHTGKLKDVVFSNILFCAVDHRVEDAATLRVQKLRARTALVNRLKMSAEKRLGRLKTAGDRIRHAAGAFLTLLFIGATTSFVAWLVVNEEEKIIPKLERSRTLRYFATMLVPVVVTFFKQASPYVVKAIVNWEGYARARDRFRTIFARSFIVRMFYVMVILFQTIFASDTRFKNEEAVTCNEAYVGIIYYKLLLVDLVVEVGISIFVPWFRLRCSCARLERTPSAHSENDLTRVIRETQDKRKDEFDISESIIDIMYRQALVWAGAPFCPLLPLVAVASGVVHMYIKIWHVVYFSRLSERPLGVSEQNQYIRVVMVITLLVSIVPYTVWLRRVPDCGPHQGKRPIDVFLDDYVQSNETLAVIFAYLSNIVFLWLVILLVLVYTMFLVKQETILESELHHVKKRLKLEVREKQAIIRDNHIQLDEDAERGREAFKDWVEEVGPVAQLYSGAFIDAGLGDLFALIRVEEMAIVELLQSFSATDEHVDLILASIEDKRIEHI